MDPLLFELGQIDLDHQDFFPVHGRLPDDLSSRVRHEALSPEFNSVSPRRRFVACSVRCRNETAVGDRMGSLDRLPGGMLSLAKGLFFAWMPADCGGIKKDFGAAQSGQSSAFWIPLIPTNQDADRGKPGFPGLEPKIPRGEIELFVE